MLKVAIVEDDNSCANVLINHLTKYGRENSMVIDTVHYPNGVEFLSEYRKVFDIVFMDIEMPLMNGMDVAKKLRGMDEHICLIFVTNMSQYAIKGYEVNAQDFMVKPVGYFNLSLKLDKAVRRIRKNRSGEIAIPFEDGIKRFYADDILYLEIVNHNILIYSDTGVFKIRSSMAKMEQRFDGLGFAKCNSCYLVNLKHVSLIKNFVVYVGTKELQMSRAKRKDFYNDYMAYLGGRYR